MKERTTQSEAFSKHLNVLRDAQRAYIQAESEERLRRALCTKVRAAKHFFFFYKREVKERGLGPAKVVFQDGKVVFIRYGGLFVRVSLNRLTKTYESQTRDGE